MCITIARVASYTIANLTQFRSSLSHRGVHTTFLQDVSRDSEPALSKNVTADFGKARSALGFHHSAMSIQEKTALGRTGLTSVHAYIG